MYGGKEGRREDITPRKMRNKTKSTIRLLIEKRNVNKEQIQKANAMAYV